MAEHEGGGGHGEEGGMTTTPKPQLPDPGHVVGSIGLTEVFRTLAALGGDQTAKQKEDSEAPLATGSVGGGGHGGGGH
jgi:hypothetical protein